MATLEQIGAALKAADAAGNTDDARRLAQAYAQMRDAQGPAMASNALPTATVRPTQDDLDAAQPRSSIGDFVSGIGRGLYGTAQGVGQMLAHSMTGKAIQAGLDFEREHGLMPDFAKRLDDNIGPRAIAQSVDDRIKADDAAFNAGAGSTFAGKAGNVAGGIIATAPIGAASIPAKGASLLSAIGRSALAGGIGAVTQPVVQSGDGNLSLSDLITDAKPDPSFGMQKLQQAALGAGFGAAVPAAGRAIMSGVESALPANLVQRVANFGTKAANAKPYAAESEALSQRTGIPFTPGQVSGAKMQTGLENLARQSFFSADKAFEADTRTANAAVAHINRMMDNIAPGTVSAEGVGNRVQDTVRNVVKSIADNRDAVASKQYGALDKMLGNAPVVRYNKTAEVLQSMLGEYADVPGPAAAAMRSQLQGMLDDIAKKPAYSLSSAQKARSAYGRAASGSADIFKDVKTSEQARIAKRLYGAMTDDIETSAAALDSGARSGPGLMTQTDNALMQRGGVADLWRKANQDYRDHSKLIEAMEASPLRRLVGDKVDVGDFMTQNKLPPERVISTLGGMAPSELKMVGNVMQRQAPDVWQDYKRLLVQNALDEAQAAPASMGANTLPLNAAKFVSALGGGKPAKIAQLRALFDPKEYAQIDDAFNAMRRLGDKFGANFSGTAPANEVLGILRGGVRGAVNVASQTVGMRKIANVMLNADGRRALVELSRLPPQSRQAASLAGYIVSLANSGPDGQENQNAGSQEQPSDNPGQEPLR